jgi:hypothetical protein
LRQGARACRSHRPPGSTDRATDAPVRRDVHASVVVADYVPIVAATVQSMRDLVRHGVIRAIAVAAISAIVATLLYFDSFAGTAQEILGIAAVGFMSDFTFESTLDAVLKRRA